MRIKKNQLRNIMKNDVMKNDVMKHNVMKHNAINHEIKDEKNNKMNNKMNDKTKKNQKNLSGLSKTQKGGHGILGSIEKSVGNYMFHVEDKKDYSLDTGIDSIDKYTKTARGLSTMFNSKKRINPGLLNIIYNPNYSPINLDILNQSKGSIKSSLIDREPYVKLGKLDRFLLLLSDNDKSLIKRVLWLAEFNNGGKSNSLIPYVAPIPLGTNNQSYIFRLYNYPKTMEKYIPYDSTGQNRTAEFTKFMDFLNKNNNNQPISIKLLNVVKDSSSGTDLFTMVKTISVSNTTNPKNEMAKFAKF